MERPTTNAAAINRVAAVQQRTTTIVSSTFTTVPVQANYLPHKL